MRIGVFGTGAVGHAIASRLVELGHEVTMGSRSATNQKAQQWADDARGSAHAGTFADAAGFGEIIFNCTKGDASLAAIGLAGEDALTDKVLIDLANPLDFSQGMPPTLFVKDDDSLAEQIQRAFPKTRVVKSLNTINCNVMVHPDRVPGNHVVFVCGDDDGAKSDTVGLLQQFGWAADCIIDLGDLSAARATEMYLPLWLRLMRSLGTADFNVELVRA